MSRGFFETLEYLVLSGMSPFNILGPGTESLRNHAIVDSSWLCGTGSEGSIGIVGIMWKKIKCIALLIRVHAYKYMQMNPVLCKDFLAGY